LRHFRIVTIVWPTLGPYDVTATAGALGVGSGAGIVTCVGVAVAVGVAPAVGVSAGAGFSAGVGAATGVGLTYFPLGSARKPQMLRFQFGNCVASVMQLSASLSTIWYWVAIALTSARGAPSPCPEMTAETPPIRNTIAERLPTSHAIFLRFAGTLHSGGARPVELYEEINPALPGSGSFGDS
jgi:hypothetical protein